MHALVVRVTIHNTDRTRDVLNNQVVPGVSSAPGFKTGYWTWQPSSGETNGLSMVIFDSEDGANRAADLAREMVQDIDSVELEGVEVREVVAHA